VTVHHYSMLYGGVLLDYLLIYQFYYITCQGVIFCLLRCWRLHI